MTKLRETRDCILTAARAEFAERGFAGARMARIAERAGVNKQLLFYYFKSKAGLHAAAAGGAGAGPSSATPAPALGTPPERVRRGLRDLQTELETRPDLAALLVDPAAAPEAAAVARAYVEQHTRRFAEIISSGQGLGYFRDGLDPALTARQAMVLVTGYLTIPALASDPSAVRQSWGAAAAELLLRNLSW